MIENKNKIFGMSPHKGGDYFDEISMSGLDHIRDKITEAAEKTGLSISYICDFYWLMNPPDYKNLSKRFSEVILEIKKRS